MRELQSGVSGIVSSMWRQVLFTAGHLNAYIHVPKAACRMLCILCAFNSTESYAPSHTGRRLKPICCGGYRAPTLSGSSNKGVLVAYHRICGN